MNVLPLYIFDIDGTLCNTKQREHLVPKPGDPKEGDKWKAFFNACIDDAPIRPTILTLDLLATNAECWLFTARPEYTRVMTTEWMCRHTRFFGRNNMRILRMRESTDFRPDHEVKRGWYEQMSEVDQQRLVAVYEDRDKVVQMWREQNVTCYQVAPGSF